MRQTFRDSYLPRDRHKFHLFNAINGHNLLIDILSYANYQIAPYSYADVFA